MFPSTFDLVLHASATSYFMTLCIFENHMSQLHDMLFFCSEFPKFCSWFRDWASPPS